MVHVIKFFIAISALFICIAKVSAEIGRGYFLNKKNKSAEVAIDTGDVGNIEILSNTNCPFGENTFGTKNYNKTCRNNLDCQNDNFRDATSMLTCKNGFCDCWETHHAIQSPSGVRCELAPGFMQPCTNVCQKPFVCKLAPPNVIMLATQMQMPIVANVTDAPQSNNLQYSQTFNSQIPGSNSPTLQNLCLCDEPYVLLNGFNCVLNCAENETYDVVTLTCFKTLSIGEICEHDLQCRAGFSECANTRCSCRVGFENVEGMCKPSSLSCPFGQPLMNDSNYAVCTKLLQYDAFPTPSDKKDDCPNGYFCLIDIDRNNADTVQGHCCPKPSSKCPAGEPHLTGTCQATSNVEASVYCPQDTHFCYNVNVDDYFASLCCPKKCASDTVSVQENCYPKRKLGDQCQYDEQCAWLSFATCSNGLCKCGPQSYEIDNAGLEKYCILQCDWEKETTYNAKCYPFLKIGDSCRTESWRCPAGTMCDRFGKCSCQCGFVAIGQTECALPPVCFRSSINIAENAAKSSDTLVNGQTQGSNVTFCRIKNKLAPLVANIVDECGQDQYCSPYVTSMGICCPKPARLCPFGQMPLSTNSCNSTHSNCGQSEFCHLFMISADLLNSDGICCRIPNGEFFGN